MKNLLLIAVLLLSGCSTPSEQLANCYEDFMDTDGLSTMESIDWATEEAKYHCDTKETR